MEHKVVQMATQVKLNGLVNRDEKENIQRTNVHLNDAQL